MTIWPVVVEIQKVRWTFRSTNWQTSILRPVIVATIWKWLPIMLILCRGVSFPLSSSLHSLSNTECYWNPLYIYPAVQQLAVDSVVKDVHKETDTHTACDTPPVDMHLMKCDCACVDFVDDCVQNCWQHEQCLTAAETQGLCVSVFYSPLPHFQGWGFQQWEVCELCVCVIVVYWSVSCICITHDGHTHCWCMQARNRSKKRSIIFLCSCWYVQFSL